MNETHHQAKSDIGLNNISVALIAFKKDLFDGVHSLCFRTQITSVD